MHQKMKTRDNYLIVCPTYSTRRIHLLFNINLHWFLSAVIIYILKDALYFQFQLINMNYKIDVYS